jgi:Leucine-rich repeat (LRR) protein
MSSIINDSLNVQRPTSTSVVPSPTNRNSSLPGINTASIGFVTPPKRSQSADPLRKKSSTSSTSSISSLRRDSSSNSINEMYMDNKLFTRSDQEKMYGSGKLNRHGSISKDRSNSVDKRVKKNLSSKKNKLRRQTSSDAKKTRWDHHQHSAPSAIRLNSWGLESLSDTATDTAIIHKETLESLTSGILHLARMKLKAFPKEIIQDTVNRTDDGIFQNISKINLYKNRIRNLPKLFFEWFKDNLIDLHINDNVFIAVPEGLKHFTSLEKLNVANNRIKSFPLHVVHLTNLLNLNLSNNQLKEFPRNLNLPSSLRVLNLGKNSLYEIPRAIFELRMLNKLDLYNNLIEDIPPGIVQMDGLTHLDLTFNKIEELPSDIFNCSNKLTKLKTLLVVGNPLYMPQRSVFHNQPHNKALQIVRQYFRKEGNSTANRIHFKRISKAIFLGAKGAGKTSCVNLLLNKHGIKKATNNNNTEKSNIGIEISELSIPSNDNEVKLPHKVVLWDMIASGKNDEDDYKATHKLFFTSSRALYIVVFNLNVFREVVTKDMTRWGDKDIEEWNLLIDTHIGEWVQSIHNHVPNAKILLCGTHVDKIPRSKRDKVLKRILDIMIRKAKERNAILKVRLEKLNKVNLPSLNNMIRRVERIYKTSQKWEESLCRGCIIRLSMPIGGGVDKTKMQNNRKVLQSKISEICDQLLLKERNKKTSNAVPRLYLEVRDLIFELRGKQPFFKVDDIVENLQIKYEEDSSDGSNNSNNSDYDEEGSTDLSQYVDEEVVMNALEFLNDRSDIIFFKNVELVFVNISWVVLLIKYLVTHIENRNTYVVTTEDLFCSWREILNVDQQKMKNILEKQDSNNGDQSNVVIDNLSDDVNRQIECLYNLMEQCGILFQCKEPHKSLLLCKIPKLNVNDESAAQQVTKRFKYPLEDDIEVARFVCFENGYVPHGLIHVIQARWMESVNDEKGFPKETDPYFADAAILHTNDYIQIYLRFGNTKGSSSIANGNVSSQISDLQKQKYHNFLGIFVRHSDNDNIDTSERENPKQLHKYCDLIMRIVLGILTTNYPGLIVTVQLPCPMCCRKYPHISQASRLDVLDIYEKEQQDIMCGKCELDKTSGSNFGIPIQQTIPMDYDDASYNSNVHEESAYSRTIKSLASGRTIVQSPFPAVVSIGLIDSTYGCSNIVELGSGVCLDEDCGIFLTAAHIIFEEIGKSVGHSTKISNFDNLDIYIGLYQGETNSPKWAFRADKVFLKKIMKERENRGIYDDILILKAYQRFKYFRTPSFGSNEDTKNSDKEYLDPSITNVETFENAKDSVQESLQVTLSSLRRAQLNHHREISIFGYPGIPSNFDDNNDFNTPSLESNTGQGKICSSKCIIESADDQYIYVYDLKHDKGSSGGPALVKRNDGKKYEVVGIIVGGVRERKYVVAQEKCEWMLELAYNS